MSYSSTFSPVSRNASWGMMLLSYGSIFHTVHSSEKFTDGLLGNLSVRVGGGTTRWSKAVKPHPHPQESVRSRKTYCLLLLFQMPSGKTRCTRKLRSWMVEQVSTTILSLFILFYLFFCLIYLFFKYAT